MTTKEQFASLWAQLGTVEGACCRAMMGEYILYYEGRVIGGIYDGRVLVKDLPAARRLAGDPEPHRRAVCRGGTGGQYHHHRPKNS